MLSFDMFPIGARRMGRLPSPLGVGSAALGTRRLAGPVLSQRRAFRARQRSPQ